MNKLTKRIGSYLIAGVMVLSILPTSVNAGQLAETSNGETFAKAWKNTAFKGKASLT